MDLGPVAGRDPTVVPDPSRKAAVLIPVIDGADPELVFIERAANLLEHPGEMGFPGGGYEPKDGDRQATAVRESGEEIGLLPEEITPVGRLDDIETVTGYTVSPFVARVPERDYRPTDAEVAEVVPLPVAALTDPENHTFEPREHPEYGTVPCHHFRVGDYTIWGATARMLVQLLTVGTEWETPEPPAQSLGELIGGEGIGD
ncbi:MAG: CoA pyrophosphatase [Halodesulfurarchaeum sp.]|nr:CoA pyrophosphatase [Halodesulfurarchaeum sp.]